MISCRSQRLGCDVGKDIRVVAATIDVAARRIRFVLEWSAALLVLLLLGGCETRNPPAKSMAPDVPAAKENTFNPARVREADISILFIGNSHTGMHDLPNLVRRMIRFRQSDKSVYCHFLPVGFLEDVARVPMFRKQLEAHPWKFVVLQAQKISTSGRFHYSRKEAIEFARLAKSRGATVLFYPEWGQRGVRGDGARRFAVYREMAGEAKVAVAPVPTAWDLALSERPKMPLYEPDGNHQSSLGAFLTACVLYGSVTGRSPSELAAFPHTAGSEMERGFLAGIANKAIAAQSAPESRTAP